MPDSRSCAMCKTKRIQLMIAAAEHPMAVIMIIFLRFNGASFCGLYDMLITLETA